MLVSEAPGYALRLAPGAIDLDRFEQHAASGARRCTATSTPPRWPTSTPRSPSGAASRSAASAATTRSSAIVVRLDEEHAAVVEDRFEVLLRLGRHGVAVSGLQEAVDERPLRERRWGQLALALYRSHRQADALRAIGSARAMLADELGLVPGPELQALETQILAHAPELGRRRRAGGQSRRARWGRSSRPAVAHGTPRRPAHRRCASSDASTSGG